MKKTNILLLALMMVAGMRLQAQSESLTVPLSDPGKPFKLHVALIKGGITVTGYEGKDIVIEVVSGSERKKREKDGTNVNVNVNVNVNNNRDKESVSGMRKLSANNGIDISATEKNNKVMVNSGSWKHAVDLVIKVPASGGSLKLDATNDGDIVVNNISGELEIQNTNGAITLNGISGSAVANTVNGNLVCVFKSVDGNSPMAFSTLNGKVDITFPALVKANIKAKSDRGEVYSDFDVDVDKTPAKMNRTAEKGMYKLNIEDWIYGKINGGGPEMLMKTMNGNIYIRKAK